ncbi:MAG TPA: ComF family protein [Elusimicrobiales bacterium]|nr:ComF family protein [Elusimicrobiales bacterium]
MGFNFSKACKYLLNALLPRTCPFCAADLPYLDPGPLCRPCTARLEPLPELHCKKCGLPLKAGGAACYDCRGAGPRALDAARSALVFNPQLRSLLHAFKYGDRDDLAGFFAGEMGAALDRFEVLEGHAFVLDVPLHPSKFKARGYNQAELLARGLAANKGLFYLEGTAARVKNTPSQTSLSKAERRKNMDGAFKILKPELVKGRRLLLVDDVATTLATLESLAAELKAAGAKSVAAYTLAREP